VDFGTSTRAVSPGNLSGTPVQVHFDPASSTPIALVADKVIPPIPAAVETDTTKFIKFQSQILSKWWGQPIYLGAIVQLPVGYDTHPGVKYPIVYNQGHFQSGPSTGSGRGGPSTGSGRGGGGGRGGAQAAAPAGPAPRMITVSLQHPSPYYDDSYGVNSQNNGPYGDAIMQELVPAIESRFRVIREPWARMLTGGSTGGWIALAHQIFYPDFYGGAFASCPDSVDFRYHQIVNIYSDANAYWVDKGWMKIDRPDTRSLDGNVTSTMKDDENWSELVQGDHHDPAASGTSEAAQPGRARWLPSADLEQEDRQKSTRRSPRNSERTTTSQHRGDELTTLGPKIANKINICVGDATLPPEHGRPHVRHVHSQRGQSGMDRRNRLPADGAPLLGPARR
jgi:hypothetical protein